MAPVSEKVRRQSERLLNVLFALRTESGWVDREHLRSSIADYRDAGDEAFDRMFTRDKATLKSIGITISTRDWMDPVDSEVVYGYRISEADYQLGELTLTPAEAVVASVAGRLVSGFNGTGPAARALTKLAGLTLRGDDDCAQAHAASAVPAETPMGSGTFSAAVRAIDERRPVAFRYRKPAGQESVRRINPYALTVDGSKAYLVGFDLARGEIRVFRLNRILGDIDAVPGRRAGSYAIPDDFDVRTHIARFDSASRRQATIRVGPSSALPLRERGTVSGDVVVLEYRDDEEFITELLSYGCDIDVIEPTELRSAWSRALEQTRSRLLSLRQEGTAVPEAGGSS